MNTSKYISCENFIGINRRNWSANKIFNMKLRYSWDSLHLSIATGTHLDAIKRERRSYVTNLVFSQMSMIQIHAATDQYELTANCHHSVCNGVYLLLIDKW